MVTTIVLFTFVTLAIAAFALSAWALWLGAKWAKIPDVSIRRALFATLFVQIAVLLVASAEWIDPSVFERYPVGGPLAQFVAALTFAWFALRWLLRTTLGRAILAWLPTLVAGITVLAIVQFVVTPLLFESFVSPTNAMAPTLLGDHVRAECPNCGGDIFVPASQFTDEDHRGEMLAICGTCFHAGPVQTAEGPPRSGDRFLVVKFLDPRRWDLVVFEYPADPSVLYVMRLVGLPGEEIRIREGDVWIDGIRVRKPGDIARLVYTGNPLGQPDSEWGPVTLGEDEYFVLGDFSLLSSDSRVWPVGAESHPAYAVPKSHLRGVVSHINWPPSRWRAFR